MITTRRVLADAEKIAALQKWQREMVEIQAGGGKLEGYREMGAQLAAKDEQIDTLRAAIKALWHEIEMLRRVR